MSAAMVLRLGQSVVQRQALSAAQRRFAELLELPDDVAASYIDELVRQNPALAPALDVPEERVRALRAIRMPEPAPSMDRPASAETLFDALASQVRLQRMDEDELMAAIEILGDLDDHGLLSTRPEELAERCDLDLMVVESARRRIQRLDPPGCASVSVKEYLTLMVQLQWPEDPFFPEIVEQHLEDLRRRRFKRIARWMDQEEEDIEEYHRMLTEEIDPWPARGYAVNGAQSTRPSMTVSRCEVSGLWRVHMDESPGLLWRLDPAFLKESATSGSPEERRQRSEHIRRAREALRELEERRRLIQQVAEIAVARQRRFFEVGTEALVPLTMTAVARILRRDTSTVSRVVANRYLRWRGGVVALRDLFPSRAGGADVSIHRLHAQLRVLIAAEDPGAPRSDEELARLLSRHGVEASRRTVQKHRERLGIPASRDRKSR